jgi:hypothetical protein
LCVEGASSSFQRFTAALVVVFRWVIRSSAIAEHGV